MQIRGLHKAIYRGASLASRLGAKERSDEAQRRDAVARWLEARRSGLTVEQAAKAVGKPRSTLSRWQKRFVRKSTRPHTVRRPTPSSSSPSRS
jgi:transposase